MSICDLSELPVEQCACRRHRKVNEAARERLGVPFPARYPGICDRCEGRISEDQMIARDLGGGGYVHANLGDCE